MDYVLKNGKGFDWSKITGFKAIVRDANWKRCKIKTGYLTGANYSPLSVMELRRLDRCNKQLDCEEEESELLIKIKKLDAVEALQRAVELRKAGVLRNAKYRPKRVRGPVDYSVPVGAWGRLWDADAELRGLFDGSYEKMRRTALRKHLTIEWVGRLKKEERV